MIVHLDIDSRSTMASAYLAKLDNGTGPFTWSIYTGPMPASTATAITSQVLLGTFTGADPAGVVSGPTLTFSPLANVSGLAVGTAAWARLCDSDGVVRGDFDVTDLSGSGAIKMESVEVTPGRTLRIVSAVMNFGS